MSICRYQSTELQKEVHRTVREPIESLYKNSLLGVIIQLELKEALEFGPLQDAMLIATNEPFSKIQLRETSKRFWLNVVTFGFFTKWLIPDADQVLKQNGPPLREFINDVTCLTIKSSETDAEFKKLLSNKSSKKVRNEVFQDEESGCWKSVKDWFYLCLWFNTTRKVKLIEKAIFDFQLLIILALYSILGQTYKQKGMDHFVLVTIMMMIFRIFRFMFCSFVKVDQRRKHPFTVHQMSTTQYGYLIQLIILIMCESFQLLLVLL